MHPLPAPAVTTGMQQSIHRTFKSIKLLTMLSFCINGEFHMFFTGSPPLSLALSYSKTKHFSSSIFCFFNEKYRFPTSVSFLLSKQTKLQLPYYAICTNRKKA
jgi:hypothetical protein